MDFEKFKIKDYKYWTLYLHHKPTTLGRVYLWCKRKNAVDFIQMKTEEKKEFFSAANQVKKALKKLLKPDLFNYVSAGNITQHLHVHIVPRYSTPRKFAQITFKDKDWGKSIRDGQSNLIIPGDTLMRLKEEIKSNL